MKMRLTNKMKLNKNNENVISVVDSKNRMVLRKRQFCINELIFGHRHQLLEVISQYTFQSKSNFVIVSIISTLEFSYMYTTRE